MTANMGLLGEVWSGAKLYDFPFSPSSRKVRAVACELVEAVEIRDGKILHMHPFMQPAVIALFSTRA